MPIPSDASKANCDSSADDPKQALLVDLAGAIDKINEILAYLRSEGVFLSTNNVFVANQTIRSSDAGAGVGPTLTLDRNSASPAAADSLGRLLFTGRDSAGNSQFYGSITTILIDPTSGSESGRIDFDTVVAGTAATRMSLGAGLAMAGTTDQGAGTVNATELYRNGVAIQSLPGMAKGYCAFAPDGTVESGSLNVASVTDNGTGNWTVNWATDFATATHVNAVKVEGTSNMRTTKDFIAGRTAGSTTINAVNTGSGSPQETALSKVHVTAYGVQ